MRMPLNTKCIICKEPSKGFVYCEKHEEEFKKTAKPIKDDNNN